ncbi:MAG: hypothetical protein ACXQTG_05140 [Methanoculleaceae archaeon]
MIGVLRDELRMAVIDENDSARLSEIPGDLFKRAVLALEEMEEEISRTEGGGRHEHLISLVEEMQNIRESVHDIIHRRQWKIIQLAMVHVDGHPPDKEEMRRMMPAERQMFDEIVSAINRCRSAMLKPGDEEGTESIVTMNGSESEGEEGSDQGAAPETVVVRIVEDLEPFMGIDGRVYSLRSGDIVTLPEENAGPLCKLRIALSMRLSK